MKALKNKRPLLITLVIICTALLASLTSCSIPSLFNPDSYGKKWENTFVFLKPSSMDSIYVSKYGILDDTAVQILNDTDYRVEWIKNAGLEPQVKITVFFGKVHEAYLGDYFMDQIENTFQYEVTPFIEPDDKGYYRIMLTEDLTR